MIELDTGLKIVMWAWIIAGSLWALAFSLEAVARMFKIKRPKR